MFASVKISTQEKIDTYFSPQNFDYRFYLFIKCIHIFLHILYRATSVPTLDSKKSNFF